MKAIIIALLALSFVAVALAECSATKATECSDTGTSCIANAGSVEASCKCYGTMAGCLNDAGCGAAVDAFAAACKLVGCTEEQ